MNCPKCGHDLADLGGAFAGDESVPKSYIRKVFQDIIEGVEYGPEEKIRAAEGLAKLEGYTGPASMNKREKMRMGVQIVQRSQFKVDPPKVSPGLAKPKAK